MLHKGKVLRAETRLATNTKACVVDLVTWICLEDNDSRMSKGRTLNVKVSRPTTPYLVFQIFPVSPLDVALDPSEFPDASIYINNDHNILN